MTTAVPQLSETDQGRYRPTEEELAQTIYEAVLHCIQHKAAAIEAAAKRVKEIEHIEKV